MKSIIQRLYYGELHPAEQITPQDPEYGPMWSKLEQLVLELTEKLPEEEQARFQQIQTLFFETSVIESCAAFSYALRLGAGLAGELAGGTGETG